MTPAEALEKIEHIQKAILAGQIVIVCCWTVLLGISIRVSWLNRQIRKAQDEINSILDMRIHRLERYREEMMR